MLVNSPPLERFLPVPGREYYDGEEVRTTLNLEVNVLIGGTTRDSLYQA